MSTLKLDKSRVDDARKVVAWLGNTRLNENPGCAAFDAMPGVSEWRRLFLSDSEWADALREAIMEATKPTIKLRIRVGVTADGRWSARGGEADESMVADDVWSEDPSACGIVAWHWITAEVPMPEVEQGELAGEVER